MSMGECFIDTRLGTDDVEASAKKIISVLDNMGKNADRVSENMNKSLNNAFNTKTPTAEYAKLQKDLQKLEERFDKLVDKEERFLATGGKSESTTFKRYEYDIEKLREDFDKLNAQMREMEQSGTAFNIDASAANIDAAIERIRKQREAEQQAYREWQAEQAVMEQEKQNTAELTQNVQNLGQEYQKAAEAKKSLTTSTSESKPTNEERRAQALKELAESATVADQRIVNLNNRLIELKEYLADLKKANVGLGYSDYENTVAEIRAIEHELSQYQQALNGTASNTRNSINPTNMLNGLKKSIETVTRVINTGLNKALSALKSLLSSVGKTSKKTGRSLSDSFSHGFKTLLKYTFGIRSLYVLINKFRRAVIEAFKNLAQFNNGVNPVNTSLSNLKSALTQLKNSFATAFAPILTVIEPILVRLINLISQAVSWIGMLISALTGATSFIKAKKVTEDYAKSLDKAGGSAKKAHKQLLSLYDDLIVLNKDEDNGGGGGISPNDMFEEIEIPKKWIDMANKIKNVLKDLFKPLKAAWDKVGDYVMKSWKYALEQIKALAKSIGRDFMEVWQQEATQKIFENILHIIGDIGLIVGHLARNFKKAWDENQTGLHILEAIRDCIAVIVENIHHAVEATVDWADKLDFGPLLQKMQKWIESLVPVFDTLSGIIADFYEQVLLPLGKWVLEKGLPDLLQVFIDFNEKVDWERLRNALAEFWKHLEPFAETVGEGLIIFIGKLTDKLANFLNSETFLNFLRKVEEWMDSVTPEQVADGMLKLVEALIAFKVAALGLTALTAITGVVNTLKGFFGLFGVGTATNITATSTALGTLAGTLSTFAAAAGIALMSLDPLVEKIDKLDLFFDDYNDNDDARFNERYKGISGKIKLLKEDWYDLTNTINDFGTAMDAVSEGIIITDGKMEELRRTGQLSNDDVETLIDSTMDLHPELRKVREEFQLWDASAETLDGIATGMKAIETGTITAENAFNEFQKPMWDINESALKFFKTMQDESMKTSDTVSKSVTDFSSAMDAVEKGIILTNDKLEELRNSGKLSNDDFETLTGTMEDLHPEIKRVREEFALWDATPETLYDISKGMDAIQNGTVDAGNALEEFKKPLWNMSDEALKFFSGLQDGADETKTVIDTDVQGINDALNLSADKFVETSDSITSTVDDTYDHFEQTAADMDSLGTDVVDDLEGHTDGMTRDIEQLETDVDRSTSNMANNTRNDTQDMNRSLDTVNQSLEENKQEFNYWDSTITERLNHLLQAFKSFVSGVNGSLQGLNTGKIGSALGDALGGITGRAAMPNMPLVAMANMPIPALAQGTVIPRTASEFIAKLGDNNRETEVVSPLSTIKKAVAEAISENGGNNNGTINVVLELDGDVVYQRMIELDKQNFNRTGQTAYSY